MKCAVTAGKMLYRTLLTLRRTHILPRLAGARARDARAVGPAAVTASWCMGDSATLMLACNLGQEVVAIEPLPGTVLFATSEAARRSAQNGKLEPYTTIALLAPQ